MVCTENGNQTDVINVFLNQVLANFVHIRHGGMVIYTDIVLMIIIITYFDVIIHIDIIMITTT